MVKTENEKEVSSDRIKTENASFSFTVPWVITFLFLSYTINLMTGKWIIMSQGSFIFSFSFQYSPAISFPSFPLFQRLSFLSRLKNKRKEGEKIIGGQYERDKEKKRFPRTLYPFPRLILFLPFSFYFSFRLALSRKKKKRGKKNNKPREGFEKAGSDSDWDQRSDLLLHFLY